MINDVLKQEKKELFRGGESRFFSSKDSNNIAEEFINISLCERCGWHEINVCSCYFK